MKKFQFVLLCSLIFLLVSGSIFSQGSLKIDKIMLGDRFTGYSPDRINWSPSGSRIYFNWNPDMDTLPSLYSTGTGKPVPEKVSIGERKGMPSFNGVFNRDRSKWIYAKDGDILMLQVGSGIVTQVTNTTDSESNPVFSHKEDLIIFSKGMNLFSREIKSGAIKQLTDFRQGKEKQENQAYSNDNDRWLHEDQLRLFTVLQERKQVKHISEKEDEALKPERPKTIYTGTDQVRYVRLSPGGDFITWIASSPVESQRTLIPEFVTESGYTEEEKSRSKVGSPYVSSSVIRIYDIKGDSVYKVNIDDIPGIDDQIEFAYRQPAKDPKKPEKRGVIIYGPMWSDDGRNAVVDIYSTDNKDRWIMLLDIKTGGLKLIDRQHDEAWIGGPGIRYGGTTSWLPDNRRIWFQSEASGYSHLYTADVFTGQKKAVTTGEYEIYNPLLSRDRKYWYCLSNESDLGIRELYRISVLNGSKVKLTDFGGGIEAELSPDEKYFALRVSYATRPWELYLLENREKAVPVKITESLTREFRSYNWRQPEFVRFKASDGTMVPARLYKPSYNVKQGTAVVFVHGAGYLQNVHKWWSSYSREYMFHNFLVDNGYTVLDIDYRGSSGYGRDWRTAIYRDMGGRDLDDHIDGARYLVKEQNIDPGKIGIYGGSYGGFITLMAMFTKPGTFSAGAALRPVTDWAHYNHGYTSNILNTPVSDSLAYVKSSPIYYAEGFQGALLICHGMVDDNVHFQDVVRLSQRLIELGKDNWELAVYPVEQHGFVEPSSWTDEYKRIFRLFESNLK
ncbi:MAG TPA: prolyl oligopeptidase family serine peptidase [Bacteroidales bacterium]|nr:prolyl oligopeptidase family serine peptidase [Bacteroidales bacterium]